MIEQKFIIGGLDISEYVIDITVKDKVKYSPTKKNTLIKSYIGHEPTNIIISLEINAIDNYKKSELILSKLQNLFGNSSTGLKSYSCDNSHLRSRGITKLNFESMSSKEDEKFNKIYVTLTFAKVTDNIIPSTNAKATLTKKYTRKISTNKKSKKTQRKESISPIKKPPDITDFFLKLK